jgi:hypothetical protein
MTKSGVIPRGAAVRGPIWGPPGFRRPGNSRAIDTKRKTLFFRVGLLLVATVSELGG